MSRPDQLGATPGVLQRLVVVLGALMLAGGLAAMAMVLLDIGPEWLDHAGAVLTTSVYSAVLAVRTGGRPVIFGLLALVIGVVAVRLDISELRDGATLISVVISAVLAVMITVPARNTLASLRELLIAYLVAAVGAFAALGFRPQVSLVRFDYLSQVLALVMVLLLVYRLGAGLHGLGRRGILTVSVGGLILIASAAYAEVFRRYGHDGVLEQVFDWVRSVRSTMGAFPRPIQVLVGIPALVWGTSMRAHRRQGWWVCAFGVSATTSVAGLLIDPAVDLAQGGLILGYSLVLGLLVGLILVRVDRLFSGRGGQRAQRSATPMRPEPRRYEPLM